MSDQYVSMSAQYENHPYQDKVVVFLCRNLRNNNLSHSVAGIELIKLPPRIQG